MQAFQRESSPDVQTKSLDVLSCVITMFLTFEGSIPWLSCSWHQEFSMPILLHCFSLLHAGQLGSTVHSSDSLHNGDSQSSERTSGLRRSLRLS